MVVVLRVPDSQDLDRSPRVLAAPGSSSSADTAEHGDVASARDAGSLQPVVSFDDRSRCETGAECQQFELLGPWSTTWAKCCCPKRPESRQYRLRCGIVAGQQRAPGRIRTCATSLGDRPASPSRPSPAHLRLQAGSHQPPRPSSVGRSSSHEPHHGQRAARALRWLATACSGRWGGARPESAPNLTVKSYASRSCGSRSGDFDRSWACWTTSKRSWTHPTCWTAVPGAFEWSVG
jgi:hypothetical protein